MSSLWQRANHLKTWDQRMHSRGNMFSYLERGTEMPLRLSHQSAGFEDR